MRTEGVCVRINFGAKEIEVAGSNEEVSEWWDRLAPVVANFSAPNASGDARPEKTTHGAGTNGAKNHSMPESFGEYFNEFPSTITDVEKVLAAAMYVQGTQADNCFTTGQASKLLSDQGIKLANPSQCVKQNADKKHVFAHNGKYRVSKSGIEHLGALKSPQT